MIETIAIGSALGIMLLFAATGRRVDDLIPMISLFVFATYRLLPAAQQMYQHLLKVRFCTPTVEHVYAELHGEADHILGDAAQSKGNLSTQNLAGDIFLDAVSCRYPQAEALALDAVNLRIPVGSVVAFVGATGSGKSTAAGLLMGLLSPTAGRLRVGDQAIDAHNVRQWQQRVGYVPQAIALLDDTVTSNIAFGTSQPSSARIAGAAEVAQIQSFIQDRLPDGLATRVGENGVRLSGGERQRLGIARALYRDPTLLVLDEATSALDNQTERAVIEGIHAMSGQRTVVMVAHRLNTIRHCDWIFYFDRGKLIAEGRFGDLLTNCVGFANLVQSAGESYEAAA